MWLKYLPIKKNRNDSFLAVHLQFFTTGVIKKPLKEYLFMFLDTDMFLVH